MDATTTPTTAAAPAPTTAARWVKRTPAKNIMPTVMPARVNAVPRSGCSSTSPTGGAMQSSALMTPRQLLASSRSEEHTSELQSRENLVCRLLLEKNKTL